MGLGGGGAQLGQHALSGATLPVIDETLNERHHIPFTHASVYNSTTTKTTQTGCVVVCFVLFVSALNEPCRFGSRITSMTHRRRENGLLV